MHHKEIAVFFPVSFVIYFCRRIERICKIGLNCLLKPVDIFHHIVGILLVVYMKKLVVVLLVFCHIGMGSPGHEHGDEKNKTDCRKKLFHALSIGRLKKNI